ncbi:MAG: patatin-like phospholipase family protein [Candidatus Entotheonellia bacterium]
MRKILSIDGGGIRGIIPAMLLAEIETITGKRIAHLFDLIAGTSTGGILTLGLCKPNAASLPEYAAAQLVELYEKRGREIFARSFWRGVSTVGGLTDEKYPHAPLEGILSEYFGETPLAAAITNALISSYDLESRQPFFFKSWRDEAKAVAMKWAARATSAAPTYFEPLQLQIGDKLLTLVDGGVYLNNPAVSAYAEARRLYPEEGDLRVVSLGTGQLTRPIHYDEAKGWGLTEWAIPLLSVVFDGVSAAADYQLGQILGARFFRFQTELDIASDDMDNASRANIEALKLEARQILEERHQELVDLCALLTV